ncbi:hypothetical protein [Coleofasciculus sp. H7-2]|uniref:hypothetical protein n=1 Tax=Coleofasciculus sp. H7-2 TaxID=3351545 RepID=UPI00366D7A97
MTSWEYCTVRYVWLGRGLTQEIHTVYLDGQELKEWKDQPWSVFLNILGKERWEMSAAKEVYTEGTRLNHLNEGILFFKRPI